MAYILSEETKPSPEELLHYGVKGMRWGVRRSEKELGRSGSKEKMSKHKDNRGDPISKADIKWQKSHSNSRKQVKAGLEAYNKAADEMNTKHISRINNKPKYKNVDFNKKDAQTKKLLLEYEREMADAFDSAFNSALSQMPNSVSPSGKYKIVSAGLMSPTWVVNFTDEVKHADALATIKLKRDSKGHILSVEFVQDLEHSDEELRHYGVKGMRWGVRRSRTERAAEKDAKEFARAKMFYGEGAGTRRKLIREKVNSRKNADPKYAKAFDEAYSRQDLGRHGDKARRERGRKDTAKKTKQTAGYLARLKTGEMGTQAAFTALIVSGAAFAASPQGRAMMSKLYNNVANNASSTRRGKKMFNQVFDGGSDSSWPNFNVDPINEWNRRRG